MHKYTFRRIGDKKVNGKLQGNKFYFVFIELSYQNKPATTFLIKKEIVGYYDAIQSAIDFSPVAQ